MRALMKAEARTGRVVALISGGGVSARPLLETPVQCTHRIHPPFRSGRIAPRWGGLWKETRDLVIASDRPTTPSRDLCPSADTQPVNGQHPGLRHRRAPSSSTSGSRAPGLLRGHGSRDFPTRSLPSRRRRSASPWPPPVLFVDERHEDICGPYRYAWADDSGVLPGVAVSGVSSRARGRVRRNRADC